MDETAVWFEKLQIHELCARYTLTLDSHDIAGWASCFTEDGVFGFGEHAIRGRAKIAAYGDVHKNLASRHLNTSLCFDVDSSGQRATGQSAIVLLLATKRGYRTAFLGRYDQVVEEWARAHPNWERIIRKAVTPAAVVDAQLGFDYQVFHCSLLNGS